MKALRLSATLFAALLTMLLVGCQTPIDLNPGLFSRTEDLPPGTKVNNDDWLFSPLMGAVFRGAALNPNNTLQQQAAWNNLAEATRAQRYVQQQQGGPVQSSSDPPPVRIVNSKYLVPGELNIYPGVWEDANQNGKMELSEFREIFDLQENQEHAVLGIFNGVGSAYGVQYHIRRESDGKTFINGNHWMGFYPNKDFIQVVLIAPEFLIPGEYLVTCEQDHRPIGSLNFRVWQK